MPAYFRILPAQGVVYVHYRGIIEPGDTMAAFAEYQQHPDRRPGQKQLVDLADVTGVSVDYVDLLKMQAKKADTFLEGSDHQTLIAYHAPSAVASRVSGMILKSWEGVPSVVARVLATEAETLVFLGLKERSFSELLQTA